MREFMAGEMHIVASGMGHGAGGHPWVRPEKAISVA